MARTAEQILERIKALYPAVWVVNTLDEGLAVYQGIAKIMSSLEANVEGLIASTYVLEAFGNRLDLIAKGRGLRRGAGESDLKLQMRIRSWEDEVTKPALEAGMNTLLTTQGAYIEEHLKDGGFYDRRVTFFDRDFHFYDDKFLMFTAWVPWQASALILDAFADRQQAFADRQQAFMETLTDPDTGVYKRVYDFLNAKRAAGVRFNMFIF